MRLLFAATSMRSFGFLLILGLLPLAAQVSLDDSAKIGPSPAPGAETIAPAPEPDDEAISTNAIQPAPPLTEAKLDRFAISPGTMREGLAYHEGAKAVLALTTPATKAFACRVVSSKPDMVVCGAIAFQKGEQENKGDIKINWKNIDHDCEVTVKVYDPAHPETILRSRLYLRKSLVQAK